MFSVDFSNWKYYKDLETEQNIGIMFVGQNGYMETRTLDDAEVSKWLAEGNEPLPADE